MKFENIVIGTPIIEPWQAFAIDEDDWNKVEKDKTLFTEERFLPKILVEIDAYPSVSEIRRNRKDLCVELNEVDFIDKLKVGKKKWIWILIGE